MVLSKLRTLKRLGRERRKLLREAALTLLWVRVWLVVTPFQRAARRIGQVTAATEGEADVEAPADMRQAMEIGWAVRLAAERVPFRAVCLQQAVAAKLMLRRRGIDSVMHYGVTPVSVGGKMKAHAWLDSGPARLTGFPVPADLVEVARFR